ncbi:hypothetical protein BSLG_008605 [Batrachochytrium salamandrivorans]|nr:hypothetical protein BASA62_003268 [Batrachochytrium salamandrivorans]KAH6577563.1 hypothetical protein BASA60_003969 [Batrachochytrium salamandrivorans]KAH9271857.1 hypothetical protein BASA83_005959 [Batrachochytrium salamandrivorans]KAJ1332299.1 hypothetical protein BSLG_008605 [Batrachochytrium salamandrivorans]
MNTKGFLVLIVLIVAIVFVVLTFSEVSHIEDMLAMVGKGGKDRLNSQITQAQSDNELIALSKCLAHTSDFDRTEVCWTTYKRTQMRKVLDMMDAMPREETIHFSTLASHSPHQLLIPTHQCDMLKLQRMGPNAYTDNPKGRHPDGPKWMCPEYLVTPDDTPCAVFSIGSNGDFQFEESIHKFVGDKCKIYTFDCTGTWSNPVTEFHPWCISDVDKVEEGRQFRTLTTMMKDVGVKEIHLFKIDVEGFEFNALRTLQKVDKEALPRQMLVEVHFGAPHSFKTFNGDVETWVKPATDFYRAIDTLGYSIALRERNIYSDCCAEYILIKNP